MYRLFLALRYLRSRLVNLISIGGVMAGVAVLIVVVAIMDGFQERVKRVVRGSLSHLILTPTVDAEHLPPFDVLEAGLKRDVPEIAALAPQIRLPVFHEYVSRKRQVVALDGMALHQMEAVGIDWRREKTVSELSNYMLAVFRRDQPFFYPRAVEFEQTTCLVSRTFAENFVLGALDESGKVIHPYGVMRDDRTRKPKVGKALREAARSLLGHEVRIVYGVQEEKNGERRFSTNSKNLIISGVYDAHDAVEDNQRIYLDIGAVRDMGAV